MKASKTHQFAAILCAAFIGTMYAIGEPWGIVLFTIFGLYYVFK